MTESRRLTVNDDPGDLLPPDEAPLDFEAGFGEPLRRVLDLETWDDGSDFGAAFARIEAEVGAALRQEAGLGPEMRRAIFPRLEKLKKGVPGAGVYQVTIEQLKATQRNVLFNGGVEACDGTCSVHDTLPLTVTQIGVCLVSYLGEQGAWGHRLFRRDLRLRGPDPLDEAIALLERREMRGGVDHDSDRDRLSELSRRRIMSYAERAALLRRAKAPWLMGHGQPAPYELITWAGSGELLRLSLDLLSELILERRRFVFVPSAPGERQLQTLGQALRPLEFLVFDTMSRRLERILDAGSLRGGHRARAETFVREVGPQVVIGVYRTYAESPPQVFYAHADHAQEAALIAMADSLLQPQRSFPTLIDLADVVCASVFGSDGFKSAVQSAYARHGHPLRYLGERETRR